jgi:uncharacterized protein YecT (DUF1311 family)
MRIFFLVLFFLLAPVSTLIGQTQAEMNQEADDKYSQETNKLNSVYHELLKKYSKDTKFIINLKIAQRKWIDFRDAQLAMKFPKRSIGFYGSVLPMCKSYYLAELAQARTKQLDEWLVPYVEGDVCAGTIGKFEN